MFNQPKPAKSEQVVTNVGVSNPYALAELVAGQKIDWAALDNKPRVLEELLQTPYEELFDPQFEGPLFFGTKLNQDFQIERVQSPLHKGDDGEPRGGNDFDTPFAQLDIQQLADLKKHFNEQDTSAFIVTKSDFARQGYVNLTVRLPERSRVEMLSRTFTPEIAQAFIPNYEIRITDAFIAALLGWQDLGRFFNEATEFFDPVQGAVANCYYIAALSAVAWSMPLHIANMTRATGLAQQQFRNMIRFYRPDSGGTIEREVEVTDNVPINTGTGGFLYARSSEAGEIWPAVYEKAYAKHITNTTSDYPNIPATAYGDMVWATAQLTGGHRQYVWTNSTSADDLWNKVRSHSMSRRTFNPMTAWTYSSGAASPDKVVYSDANLVANHAYTVLGWDYHNGRKYIIVRNPWGSVEGTVGALNTTWLAHDISWWRPVNLATIDGTFGIEASAFKKYFAGLGVVV
jgi:hypothetical protein